jgi:hypothetical protein
VIKVAKVKTELIQKVSVKSKSANSMKVQQIDALERLRDQLQLLVRQQGTYTAKARDSSDPMPIHQKRLAIFDQSMHALVESFKALEEALTAKHPGGAPLNKYRNQAFDLMTDRYITNGHLLKSKELVKAVLGTLSESDRGPDASGNEPFSQRIASAVIRDFKACLHSRKEDWN